MLKHNTSTVAVYQTDQYKNFSMILGNRGINIKKVTKIIKEIEAGNDMLQYYPIQVKVLKDKLEILDGQHRFFICKKLKKPVHYILVSENKDMTDIARVNSNVERWQPRDFINCFIQRGNKNYNKLQAFLEKYKFGINLSIKLLETGNPGSEGTNQILSEKFERGNFEVLKFNEATSFADDVKSFSDFPFHTDRGFIIALYRIKIAEKITLKQLLDACKKNPDMLVRNGFFKEYIVNLEQVVNKGKQKRIVIT